VNGGFELRKRDEIHPKFRRQRPAEEIQLRSPRPVGRIRVVLPGPGARAVINPKSQPCPFGPEFQVFWDMRYTLMSKFDQARVDATGLYTMVPEAFALDMARRAGGSRSLDICSGIGAMSIALARAGQSVTAVEIDAERVAMARHNAALYGVGDRIDFRLADITAEATLRALPKDIDTAVLDPPWGKGPGDYQRRPVTRLADLQLAGLDLRELVGSVECREVMMRLPPNFDIGIFREASGEKLAYVTSAGYLHWYFIRMPREQFARVPDRSDFRHDSAEARSGFVAVTAGRPPAG
jgi:trimethylguanosine synthase